jgi:hypothetical protein
LELPAGSCGLWPLLHRPFPRRTSLVIIQVAVRLPHGR